VIFYADLDHADADTAQAIAAHLAAHGSKGRAALLRGGQIVLAHGSHETPLARSTDLPALPLDEALPAAACAWHLQLTPALIRASLLRFVQHTSAQTDVS